MAGHSHFKNVMRRKGAQDAKRAKVFTKIQREIIAACKLGAPDPNTNPRLRAAVQWAREENVTRDKIEAAIKRASGGTDTAHYDSIRYEGYGPGGVAVIVQALSDNRNRTAADVRAIFTKYGGNLGETGSVSFSFQNVGMMTYPAAVVSEDAMLEAALDAGAEDCAMSDGEHRITCAVEHFGTVRDGLEKKFGAATSAKLTWIATNTSTPSEEQATALFKMVEALEDHDDVQEVFTNVELSEAVMQRLAG